MDSMSSQAQFQGAHLVFGSGRDRQAWDAAFLISSLLVSVAKGDGSISDVETTRMLDIVSSRVGTGNAEALRHLSSAVMSLANDEDIVLRLTHISEGLSGDEREAIFCMVLEIALADGILDPGEAVSINLAGQILGFSQDRIYSELRSIDPDYHEL
jgi:uncharacterized tellurite resistance protein B-like protein